MLGVEVEDLGYFDGFVWYVVDVFEGVEYYWEEGSYGYEGDFGVVV